MNAVQIREYCVSKPGVEESLPFGDDTLVFKVEGKMFLLLALDEQPPRFNVKCDPEEAIALRQKYSSVLPGYHMNKLHWNTVVCDGVVPSKQLKQFIDASYDLVNTKGRKRK
jgi:predicted DNA-binding protein (MmcQ/YjbR family)